MKSAFCAALMVGCSWLGSAGAAEPDPTRPVAPAPSSEAKRSRFRLRLVVPLWLPFLSAQTSASHLDFEADNVKLESQVSWVVTGLLEAGYKPERRR